MAICGSQVKALQPDNHSLATIEIDGVEVTAGVIITREPTFKAQAPENRLNVLVKIKGFSCNYRDLNMIFAAVKKGAPNSYFAVGSDLTGEIIEIGNGVTRFKVGDRVISDNHYSGQETSGVREGVLTNQASKEYQVFHQDRLSKIPDEMPDEVAAAFSIGAQTTYSMLRKLELRPGSKILVTAAKSNTSLFAIQALRQRQVQVYATSTSRCFESELLSLGVRELIQIDPCARSFLTNEQMQRIISEHGQFEYVFDPYYDLHLHKALEVMGHGARYITCGFLDQYKKGIGTETLNQSPGVRLTMCGIMSRNLQIFGNCIGTTADLNQALEDYQRGTFRVTIDSGFSGDDVGNFFHRTYSARDRFGKVVFLY